MLRVCKSSVPLEVRERREREGKRSEWEARGVRATCERPAEGSTVLPSFGDGHVVHV